MVAFRPFAVKWKLVSRFGVKGDIIIMHILIIQLFQKKDCENMNITDMRTGDRRAVTRRTEDTAEDLSAHAEIDETLVDLRSGKDRRETDRRMSAAEGESDAAYVRVPINPEIQNLLFDMYSDDQEK